MKNHILIVDDEKDIRELLTDVLETKGYQITTASDGNQALELASKTYFDLYIVDFSMPEMDGITLLKEIKKIQPLAVIIILTGFTSIEGAVDAIHAGAYQYLSKPIKSVELFELVDKAIQFSVEQFGPLQTAMSNENFTSNVNLSVLFSGFTNEERNEFIKLGTSKSFKFGESINDSDTANNYLIIIESGDVSVWMSNCVFDYLKKNDTWGEENIMLESFIPVILRAESSVTALYFERKKVLDFFNSKDDNLLKKFIINVSGSISLKWRKAIQRLVMQKLINQG